MYAALSPTPAEANTLELLRSVAFNVDRLRWAMTSGKASDRPEPMPFPWDPKPEGSIAGDEMEWDEAAAFLGWEAEMAAYFD